MKKIAIVTSGLLPIPAIKDGAIEMLLQYTIDENEREKKYDFVVYSTNDDLAKKNSNKFKNTKFEYIKINSILRVVSYNFNRILRKFGDDDPNFQFQFINKVIKKIKKEKFDYIIVESENHFAYKVLKKCNIPTLLYLHNDKLNKNTKQGTYIADNLYKIITVSDYLKSQVLTLGKQYNNKIQTIHNGVDVKQFYNVNSPKSKNTFLYVGRVEPNKGTLELVQAFNNLNIKDKKLIIVGGTFHSSNKKSKYVKKIFAIANDNIEFKGYVPHKDLNRYYKDCNILVIPSMWEEPAGLVNIEAISSNIKLIVSNSGGICEYINKSAIIFNKNKNTVKNLTKAMNDAIVKRKTKIDDEYIKYFSKEEYVKRYYDYLEKVLGR